MAGVIRTFTVTVDMQGRATVRAPDGVEEESHGWAVNREVPLDAVLAAADALGIRVAVEVGLQRILVRLDEHARVAAARLAAAEKAQSDADALRARIAAATVRP